MDVGLGRCTSDVQISLSALRAEPALPKALPLPS